MHSTPHLRLFAVAQSFSILWLAGELSLMAVHAAGLAPFNTEPSTNGPMNPAEVVSKSTLPPGFRLSVFASEPDVQQPIAMTTDPRGRLWVAENYTYSERTVGFHPQLRDRIVVFEDTDNDGRFDRRTVFWDAAERLTSIEVGLGGVWALCLPNLVFIPDSNGDDVPDGPPRVLLDGFNFANARHNVANGLRWGPDGWLYGRHGILATSKVGPPGMPDSQRTQVNVGIWRFHPTHHSFEMVAQGTTNPWGTDWDTRGEGFFINTVIGHLWHVIPGAHYRRMYGDDANPFVYELIEQHADHVHWATGEVWTDVRKGVSDATLAAGGGHAHSGLIIYQGGQWPESWNGKLLTVNFHGRRLNVERLERNGSGLIGRSEPDAFLFADPWFRGLDLIAAPDGGVFVSDWSDAGECHDENGIHRTSGRIYKLSYGRTRPGPLADLTKLADAELVRLQTSANDWESRQARRVLADRALKSAPPPVTRAALSQLAEHGERDVTRLRAMWALHLLDADEPALLTKKLTASEAERIWAIRLYEDRSHRGAGAEVEFTQFVEQQLTPLARTESSAAVRLALASLLQKLAPSQRVPLAAGLLQHPEDDGDHNLPQTIWYGLEPLALTDPRFVDLTAQARLPHVQRLAARRLAEAIDTAPKPLDSLLVALGELRTPDSLRAILDGMAAGLAGRRKVSPPPAWSALEPRLAIAPDEMVRTRARDLGALFGDGRALDQIRATALNPAADLPQRRRALQALVDARPPDLRAVCEQLLPIRDLSATAAAGLGLFDDPAVADRLLAEWPNLYGHERPAVLNALLARRSSAAKLLEAIAAGKMNRNDLGVFQARQIKAFQDPPLTARLRQVWGEVQDLDDNARRSALTRWKNRLTPAALAQADLREGQTLFQTTCAPCHQLYGAGGKLGPDLTGTGRENLDYLLENILFPSAIIPADYRQTTLTMKDGRVLTGVLRRTGPRTLTLEQVGQTSILENNDVEREDTSNLSLMPEGLLDALDEGRVRSLIRFLMSKDPPRADASSH